MITIPCLQTTCQTQSNPPPQKNQGFTKTKSPCVPNNHPRKAAETLKILHQAKLVVTPMPLNRWHPPSPPALTAPTDGLLIFSEHQPPPPTSRRASPISELNAGVFFAPPHRLPYPPPSMRFILGQTLSEPQQNNEAPAPSSHLSNSQPFSSSIAVMWYLGIHWWYEPEGFGYYYCWFWVPEPREPSPEIPWYLG